MRDKEPAPPPPSGRNPGAFPNYDVMKYTHSHLTGYCDPGLKDGEQVKLMTNSNLYKRDGQSIIYMMWIRIL